VGTLGCHIFAKHFILIQRHQALFGLTIVFVVADALQDFQKYEVPDSDRSLDYRGIQQVSMWVSESVEIVNPDAGIHKYHPAIRISLSTPSHVTLRHSHRISYSLT